MKNVLQIYSIFHSIDGEVNRFHQGSLCTFIRLAGCNLRCKYCDTTYAQDTKSGKQMTITQILEAVAVFGTKKITITGGEPLLQQPILSRLVSSLLNDRYNVSIETNGTFSPRVLVGVSSRFIPVLYNNLSFVVDCKLKSSGFDRTFNPQIFFGLSRTDFVKFVVQDLEDFRQAESRISNYLGRGCRARLVFSPVYNVLDPTILFEWICNSDCLEIHSSIVNLQLHKIIWPKVKFGEER